MITLNFFEFTKTDFDYIVKECMLDEEYQKLLEYKIKGYSIAKIAQLLNVSEGTVSVMVSKLKKKIKKIL
jgi:DNA-binding NarL/FixJ family response regulator